MQLLTVGDVARRLGIAAETVRLWERLGKLPVAERTASGMRLWNGADVERLRRAREVKAGARARAKAHSPANVAMAGAR
jgi:DNA-binding transcriptional MerR regulator